MPSDRLAAAEALVRKLRLGHILLGDYFYAIQDVMAEYDRMHVEVSKAVADCGICRLGGRTIHINDDCPRHGDHDGINW